MALKSVKRGIGAVVIAAAITTGMGVSSASASASTSVDLLCTAVDDTPVHRHESGSSPVIYTIARGNHMRVHVVDGTWFFGHGQGHSDGWAYYSHFINASGTPTCY